MHPSVECRRVDCNCHEQSALSSSYLINLFFVLENCAVKWYRSLVNKNALAEGAYSFFSQLLVCTRYCTAGVDKRVRSTSLYHCRQCSIVLKLVDCLCGSLAQCALGLKRLSAGPGFNLQTRQNKLFQDYWRACFEINFPRTGKRVWRCPL